MLYYHQVEHKTPSSSSIYIYILYIYLELIHETNELELYITQIQLIYLPNKLNYIYIESQMIFKLVKFIVNPTFFCLKEVLLIILPIILLKEIKICFLLYKRI